MEGSAIFWIRSIPGPGKQRLSYMENLFADNQNFVTPSFERKTKTQKKKKSKQPWQTNKALSTHAMVAQAKVKAVWEDLSCFEGVGETLSKA